MTNENLPLRSLILPTCRDTSGVMSRFSDIIKKLGLIYGEAARGEARPGPLKLCPTQRTCRQKKELLETCPSRKQSTPLRQERYLANRVFYRRLSELIIDNNYVRHRFYGNDVIHVCDVMK